MYMFVNTLKAQYCAIIYYFGYQGFSKVYLDTEDELVLLQGKQLYHFLSCLPSLLRVIKGKNLLLGSKFIALRVDPIL